MLTRTWRAAMLVAATAITLALSGCTTTVPGTPTAAAGPVASPSTATAPAWPSRAPAAPSADTVSPGDRRMIAAFRAHTGTTAAQMSDTMLVLYAAGACANLDRNPTEAGFYAAVYVLAGATGWTGDEPGALIGGAVANRCPWHIGLIRSL